MIQSHIAIPTTNLDRSIEFYRSLGYVPTERWHRAEWGMIGQLMNSETNGQIELIFHKDNVAIRYPAVREVLHIAIAVSNLSAVMEDLVKKGVQVLRPITAGITVQCLAFIQDPDGLAIELFQPKA